jgi:Xaa-Pro aminopeptidase
MEQPLKGGLLMSIEWKPWSTAGVKPEWQARRVFGVQGVDWQERVNFERLRLERVQRVQSEMKKAGMSALLLYRGDNIRYVTNTWNGTWREGAFRYCLLPAGGQPLLFEGVGCDTEVDELYIPWLKGRIRPSISYLYNPGGAFKWGLDRQIDQLSGALKEEGVSLTDKIGVDQMDFTSHAAFTNAGIKNLVPAAPVISAARWTKTKDELELLKIAMCTADACFGRLREEWVKPGIKECELEGRIAEFMISHNMEQGMTIIASGGNTNPYIRSWGDKMLRPGDMVIMDIIWSYLGYNTDYVRCWPVGHIWSAKQKELYKRAYDSLMKACEAMKPGASSAEVAEKFEHYADDVHRSDPVVNAAHSIGMGLYEGLWVSRAFSKEYAFEITEGMYFAVETYAGEPGGDTGARLERNGVITDKGFEPFDLFPFEEEGIGR